MSQQKQTKGSTQSRTRRLFKVQRPIAGNGSDWLIYNQNRKTQYIMAAENVSPEMVALMEGAPKAFMWLTIEGHNIVKIEKGPWQSW
jgi:hypothetical protein